MPENSAFTERTLPHGRSENSTTPVGRMRAAATRAASFPFHPLLIAAFPVLSLYSHNLNEVPFSDTVAPLGMALAVALIVWLVAGALLRHARKGALLASAVTLVFFSYGHVARVLPQSARPATGVLLTLALLGTAICIYAAWRTLRTATRVVNLASAGLLIPIVLAIAAHALAARGESDAIAAEHAHLVKGDRGSAERAGSGFGGPPKAITAAEAQDLPDIYYIILDAYGRQDSLRYFYGYNNAPFVHALEERGFLVTRDSHANYPLTSYCIPTALNMNYATNFLPPSTEEDDTTEALRRLIDQNAVAGFLRNRGYHYVNIWTGTAATRVDSADLALFSDSESPPSTFEGELLSLSALGALPAVAPTPFTKVAAYERHRKFIRAAFRNLQSVALLPYPKFVFAHILGPHPPFVFGPNGESVEPPYIYNEADSMQLMDMHRLTPAQYRSEYIGQPSSPRRSGRTKRPT